jgi:hypothetical protein
MLPGSNVRSNVRNVSLGSKKALWSPGWLIAEPWGQKQPLYWPRNCHWAPNWEHSATGGDFCVRPGLVNQESPGEQMMCAIVWIWTVPQSSGIKGLVPNLGGGGNFERQGLLGGLQVMEICLWRGLWDSRPLLSRFCFLPMSRAVFLCHLLASQCAALSQAQKQWSQGIIGGTSETVSQKNLFLFIS